jgi:hypothetical protein
MEETISWVEGNPCAKSLFGEGIGEVEETEAD